MCSWIDPPCDLRILVSLGLTGIAVVAALGVLLLLLATRRRGVRAMLPPIAAAALALAGIAALLVPDRGVGHTWPAFAALAGASLLAAVLAWRGRGERDARTGLPARRRTLLLGGAAALLAGAATGAAAARHVWDWLLTERQRVRVETRRRPRDPWPRGVGAFLIGGFGAAEPDKTYLEPGGSLSPAVGSFGLSFWVFSQRGVLVHTSDSLPLSNARQRYLIRDGMPGIHVEAEHYEVIWALQRDGSLALDLLRGPLDGHRLHLALRSVGPAGAPLHRLEATGDGRILANGRWSIALPPGARLVALGDERDAGWAQVTPPRQPATRHDSPEGWAQARLELPQPAPATRVTVTDLARPGATPAPLPEGTPLRLEGLPGSFVERVEAQIASLLLGLVGDETRPGEPTNYPLAWQRDGAYVVVALARAGHGATARRLSRQIAEQDFFGGFGAEADAPGLALWTLGEVATALDDRDFEQAAWPHLLRKVALIERMLTATGPVRHPFSGPVVPAHAAKPDLDLIAQPARLGLINGRMDWHFPIFFVNGVSYLGLVEAAAIAGRLGRGDERARWLSLAERIGSAWRRAFAELGPGSEEVRNERTAIIGLWPAGIAERDAFAAVMEERWRELRSADGSIFRRFPVWTYFDLAEAHQWVRIGRPDRARATLDWFERNQPAPGLHSFWEGYGEENSFGRWQHHRGYIQPRNVHPHYWAAAECLLLCLEMLAYVEMSPVPTVVVGGGVAREWLARPITVAGVGTSAGPVAWRWDPSGELVVEAPDAFALRPGPEFPAGIRITRGRVAA